MILRLTVGNEFFYANISFCQLSISTCLVTHDRNLKTNEKIYSQNILRNKHNIICSKGTTFDAVVCVTKTP